MDVAEGGAADDARGRCARGARRQMQGRAGQHPGDAAAPEEGRCGAWRPGGGVDRRGGPQPHARRRPPPRRDGTHHPNTQVDPRPIPQAVEGPLASNVACTSPVVAAVAVVGAQLRHNPSHAPGVEPRQIPRFKSPVHARHLHQSAVPRETPVQRHADPAAAACQLEPPEAAPPGVVAVGPSHHREDKAGRGVADPGRGKLHP